jgi:hypothetical protein
MPTPSSTVSRIKEKNCIRLQSILNALALVLLGSTVSLLFIGCIAGLHNLLWLPVEYRVKNEYDGILFDILCAAAPSSSSVFSTHPTKHHFASGATAITDIRNMAFATV